MPIVAECAVCGRKYQASDAMAGKRVKCRQCGNVFALPYNSADPTVDFSALAELEQSYDAHGAPEDAAPGAQIGPAAVTHLQRSAGADDYAVDQLSRGPRPNWAPMYIAVARAHSGHAEANARPDGGLDVQITLPATANGLRDAPPLPWGPGAAIRPPLPPAADQSHATAG